MLEEPFSTRISTVYAFVYLETWFTWSQIHYEAKDELDPLLPDCSNYKGALPCYAAADQTQSRAYTS